MMRVLYLLNYAGKAGTERYVENLVRQLGGSKVEPYFAYHESGLLVERLEALGVPTRQIDMESRFDRKAAKALAALCEEWDIDVVHCHYLREHYIALMAKRWNRKIRVVYTNHFILANNFITRVSNKWMDKRQDQMIAVCNKGREQLMANGWSGDRIQVVFNGVDLADWAGEGSTLREEFHIPAENVVMLCASRFAGDKGHHYLVESLAKLKQATDVPFTMVLAGDGELLEPVQRQVEELGLQDRVVFTGFRKDMKNLYKGSDIYINSSEHEALSFLIIEAMAAGLPVIITNIAGNPDIVPVGSEWGLLAEYNDPDSMAGEMKKLIEDPALRAKLSAKALERVRTTFEVGKMAEDTYRVYEKAAAR